MHQSYVRKKDMARAIAVAVVAGALALCAALPAIAHAETDSHEGPGHTLTYTMNKLTWDSGTTILPDGTAELSLFSDFYRNVKSGDDVKVVAPGTAGSDKVALKNGVTGPIKYHAVCYRIKSTDILPVDVAFNAPGSTTTTEYPLPEGVDKSQVIGAVTGSLDGGSSTLFAIDWTWPFERSLDASLLAADTTAGDIQDTGLGDKAAFDVADDVKVGLYIVVEDDNNYNPKTGDSAIVLAAIVGGIALLAIIVALIAMSRRKKGKHTA